MTISATDDWPVVERWELFERIAGAERGCVLVGPGGAGKSTAARLALAPRGEPVVIAGIEGMSGVPLGALSMAEMTADRLGLDPRPGDADDLVTRVRTWLADLREHAVPLVIDDPAGLDDESAVMLTDEMHRGLACVITHRTGQPPPDPMADAIETLGLPTIEIEPFDPSMVELAIEHAIGAPPTNEAIAQLTALSGGNPMLLREIVRDLSTRDAWTREGGQVAIAADANPSDRMAELLQARYPRSPEARALLDLVAFTGSLPPAVAEAVATGETRQELVRDGWLAVGDDQRIAHPLMSQFLRDRLDDQGARRLLREALDTIGAPERLGADGRLVCLRWALACAAPIDAAELRWARAECGRRFDRDLVCRIADRLAERERTLDTTLELVLALAQAERYDEAVDALQHRREITTEPAEIIEIARYLLRFAGPIARLRRWGNPPDGVDVDTAEWADAALDTTAFGELLAAFQALADGALLDARTHAQAVRGLGIDGLHGDADEVAMVAALYGGDEKAALESFDRLALRLADATYRHPKSVVIDTAASSLLMLSGRFEQAYDFDRQVVEVARSQQDHERRREMLGHLGMTALFVGRVADATDAFTRHRDVPVPPNSLRTVYLVGLAQAHALAGRLPEAELALADAERERDVVSTMMEPDYDNMAAMVRHLLGFQDAAEQQMRRSLDTARQWQNSRSQLMALHGLARMGRVHPEDVRAVDERIAGGTHEPAPAFAHGVCLMVRAAYEHDADLMTDAADSFAGIGFALGAAEGFAAACRLIDDPTGPAFARALASLDHWLDRCPGLGGATVLLGRGVDPLTDREHQIAVLAAGGLANATIAERLGISGRTVENCLHRTFTKLGVTTRAEIADAMLPVRRP